MHEHEPGPSHGANNGESVKVTKGARVILEFKRVYFTNKRDAREHYWKSGLTLEAYRWLKDTFGPMCMDRSLWDNENVEDGKWIYLGSQQRKKKQVSTVTLHFREKSQAILFKLTWMGNL